MTEVIGPYGKAGLIPAERYSNPTTQIAGWVITAPAWHPLWSQYFLGVVSLADLPGVPPPVLHFPGATHEIMVIALDPDHGPYDAEVIGEGHKLKWLLPGNICEQIIATDEIAREISEGLAHMVVQGLLCPETGDDPDGIRSQWRGTISRSLDHYLDPHHGRLN